MDAAAQETWLAMTSPVMPTNGLPSWNTGSFPSSRGMTLQFLDSNQKLEVNG
jgi:hypothetical protein